MPMEKLIISMYCLIEELHEDILKEEKIGHRGPHPALSDIRPLA